ncbi:hypothetical protein WJX72_000107 [[Myrmecia] bisecta]|uniref:protein-serine/threonine phosphatase n=1 Tax=[Myrmecia] bisecta TaxID=41462 RepID=A0AAW1R409_9CHLO
MSIATGKKRNEDRFALQVAEEDPEVGEPFTYAAVFDGHGGSNTAEWLEQNFASYVENYWRDGQQPEAAITDAFLQADTKLLQPKGGFFGAMGERGVGGSKCGATGAVALLFLGSDGKMKLLSANVGDARVVLARGRQAVQLSEDHVPDSEEERIRIERTNPNPKMPLVRYVGGTWRTGGILALSRAFGDAYLKGSLQFEGVRAGGDGYSSGFGVIAEPYTTLTDLTPEDSWIIIASDGLFANEERGGGGGLDNQQAVDLCLAAKPGSSPQELGQQLIQAAHAQPADIYLNEQAAGGEQQATKKGAGKCHGATILEPGRRYTAEDAPIVFAEDCRPVTLEDAARLEKEEAKVEPLPGPTKSHHINIPKDSLAAAAESAAMANKKAGVIAFESPRVPETHDEHTAAKRAAHAGARTKEAVASEE